MSRCATLWPGIALSITMFDDLVAGPILAFGGAILGPQLGVPLAIAVFTTLVAGLVGSALGASRHLDAATQVRIDGMVDRASRRRFVGRFVQRVGDDHPVATAIIAVMVSPVLAVLLARLVHPEQRLHRTVGIAVTAYGLAFSVVYAAGGSAIAGLA